MKEREREATLFMNDDKRPLNAVLRTTRRRSADGKKIITTVVERERERLTPLMNGDERPLNSPPKGRERDERRLMMLKADKFDNAYRRGRTMTTTTVD